MFKDEKRQQDAQKDRLNSGRDGRRLRKTAAAAAAAVLLQLRLLFHIVGAEAAY